MKSLSRSAARIAAIASVTPAPVQPVATQREPGFREMNPDLMSAACFQFAFHQRIVSHPFDRTNPRDRALFRGVVPAVRGFCPADAIPSVPNQNGIEGLRFRMSMNHSMVLADDSVVAKGFAKCLGNARSPSE